MSGDDPREMLRRLARGRGRSLAALSRLIGRNSAYLQQYVTRGSPSELEEGDILTLAAHLGIDSSRLRAGPAIAPKRDDTVRVRRLSAEAAAGMGRLIDGEYEVGTFRFERSWLRQISSAAPEELSMIAFVGDSMAPTINDGDEGLVDHSESGKRVRDGIYVLRRDEALMVKRLAISPVPDRVTIVSDNPAYPTWPDCPLSGIDLVGRVVWIGRKLN